MYVCMYVCNAMQCNAMVWSGMVCMYVILLYYIYIYMMYMDKPHANDSNIQYIYILHMILIVFIYSIMNHEW